MQTIARKVAMLSVLITLGFFSLVSFKAIESYNDFLKQLGINKVDANNKIISGLLNASIDHYGLKNAKNILSNDRAAVIKEVAAYAKQYAASPEFKKEYERMRENNKPEKPEEPQTPEEMRANMIKQAKEGIVKSEESLKKAPANLKEPFENALEASKKNLVSAQDPENRNIKAYTRNYEGLKQTFLDNYKRQLGEWEVKYPKDHYQYIKPNIEKFLQETENVDFDAKLIEKNGKKYFVNPEYERKSGRWKMAFRAGKPAIETARTIAQQWLNELN